MAKCSFVKYPLHTKMPHSKLRETDTITMDVELAKTCKLLWNSAPHVKQRLNCVSITWPFHCAYHRWLRDNAARCDETYKSSARRRDICQPHHTGNLQTIMQ